MGPEKRAELLRKVYVDGGPLDESVTGFDGVLQEIESCSITPETLRSRKFSRDEFVKSGAVVELDRVKSKMEGLRKSFDEFKRVLEDGVSKMKALSAEVVKETEFTKPVADLSALGNKFTPRIELLLKERDALDEYLNFTTEYADLRVSYRDEYANATSEVTRFGNNTADMTQEQTEKLSKIHIPIPVVEAEHDGSVASGSRKSGQGKKDQGGGLMLHPLEVLLIREAVGFCKASGAKTVLVDIFARNTDEGGAILRKDNKPDVHTIVLYMQKTADGLTDQIIVVDPTRSSYSKHLVSNISRIFRDGEKVEMFVSTDLLEIYVPGDSLNVGPGPAQYRDCTDIGVKIGLALSNGVLDIKKGGDVRAALCGLKIVQEVSNSQATNRDLFFNAGEAVARIRQASEDIVRKKVDLLLDEMARQINVGAAYHDADARVLSVAAFAKGYDFTDYSRAIEELKGVCCNNNDLLIGCVNAAQSSLLEGVDA